MKLDRIKALAIAAIEGNDDAVLYLGDEAEALVKLVALVKQMGEALEYHIAQTRPIQQSADALTALREFQGEE